MKKDTQIRGVKFSLKRPKMLGDINLFYGGARESRTLDLRFRRPLLYPLSYCPTPECQ